MVIWDAVKSPIGRYVTAGIGLLILCGVVFLIIHNHTKKTAQANQTIGAQTERLQSQSETINAVQNADEVVQHPSAEQLNIVCNKYDRNCPHHP